MNLDLIWKLIIFQCIWSKNQVPPGSGTHTFHSVSVAWSNHNSQLPLRISIFRFHPHMPRVWLSPPVPVTFVVIFHTPSPVTILSVSLLAHEYTWGQWPWILPEQVRMIIKFLPSKLRLSRSVWSLETHSCRWTKTTGSSLPVRDAPGQRL